MCSREYPLTAAAVKSIAFRSPNTCLPRDEGVCVSRHQNRFQCALKVISVLLGLLLACGPTPAWAEKVRMLVQDQTGQPLPNAVVELQLPPATSSSAVPTEIAVMDQVAKRFVPELLVIQVGQQVEFPNSDNVRHHVYSFSATKPFELKLYAGHPEKPVVFERSGVVVMGCNIHDTMVGYIYVAASPKVAVSDKDGQVELLLDKPASSVVAVNVWHAQQSAGPETRAQFTLNSAVHRSADGRWMLPLNTSAPAQRDTFEARFRATEK
ncbi:MAG TPA: methylamine utilization protein [Cellvibrionaceae bacterium]